MAAGASAATLLASLAQRPLLAAHSLECCCDWTVPTINDQETVERAHVYMYTHIHIHTHIHTHILTYIHTYIHTYVHTYLRTYVHTYIHTYIHTCTNHMHIHIYIYIHTYIYIYIYINIHRCMWFIWSAFSQVGLWALEPGINSFVCTEYVDTSMSIDSFWLVFDQ